MLDTFVVDTLVGTLKGNSMSVAVRPYLAAGLALASVGVIAATPIAAPQQQSIPLANAEVALTAGTISNVLTIFVCAA